MNIYFECGGRYELILDSYQKNLRGRGWTDDLYHFNERSILGRNIPKDRRQLAMHTTFLYRFLDITFQYNTHYVYILQLIKKIYKKLITQNV